ncbi:hypothetical protein TNIN_213971 [Trichonephila inaurata madagascariensis]|uniref:Uncharacterized protein n=1 Tax=Trichonephila inaurata madagascariensis TaxID=2747483 RepID=A0A8X7C2Q3_9ARAC|nr:hypothetical protein TNIN_213971 [Trichonephila inaurata madagascariensis]
MREMSGISFLNTVSKRGNRWFADKKSKQALLKTTQNRRQLTNILVTLTRLSDLWHLILLLSFPWEATGIEETIRSLKPRSVLVTESQRKANLILESCLFLLK